MLQIGIYYILIARPKLYMITLPANSTDMLVRKFDIDAA
jgi:hypothetical protein